VKLALIVLAVFVTGILGYGYYLHRKLDAVMSSRSAKVQLEPYALKPRTVPTRLINLGFAQFQLPASISGEPVQVGDNLLVVLGANGGLVVGAPLSDTDEEMASILNSVSTLADDKIDSLFELKKRALVVRPFTVWSLPVMGKRKAILGATLIAIKSLFAFDSPVMRVVENSELGAFIAETPNLTAIVIHDKQKRASQEFFISPGAIDIDQVMAALMASYRFTSDETMREKWIEQMRAAGIRQRPELLTDAERPDEMVRLHQVADEVRERRAAQQAVRK